MSALSLVVCCILFSGAASQPGRQFSLSFLDDSSKWNLTAPYFGAKPPTLTTVFDAEEDGTGEQARSKQLPLHRRGWESCARCGGSERLGALLPLKTALHKINTAETSDVLEAVRAHGIIVIQSQNLTRKEQVEFTAKLGDVVVLPPSFEGKDPEPFHPAIQRITNFRADGTWKGPSAKFGAYWHQDGQFWVRPRHRILSVLHAQQTPPAGGETGFADLRAAYATLSRPLLRRASQASIEASVRDIADFAQGTEEDLAAFPDATHSMLDVHAVDGGPILYVGSPHMRVTGLESAEAGKGLLEMLLTHATSPSFTYFHAWSPGDVIVWDNTQTLHHAMPYVNDGTAHRELYRTQARLRLGDDCNAEDNGDEMPPAASSECVQ